MRQIEIQSTRKLVNRDEIIVGMCRFEFTREVADMEVLFGTTKVGRDCNLPSSRSEPVFTRSSFHADILGGFLPLRRVEHQFVRLPGLSRVIHIFSMLNPLEIIGVIKRLISILVVNFGEIHRIRDEYFCYSPMQAVRLLNPRISESDYGIAIILGARPTGAHPAPFSHPRSEFVTST